MEKKQVKLIFYVYFEASTLYKDVFVDIWFHSKYIYVY